MNKTLISFLGLFVCGGLLAQPRIDYTEYDLNNGMHVILHKDNSAPVVTTAVMYHVEKHISSSSWLWFVSRELTR